MARYVIWSESSDVSKAEVARRLPADAELVASAEHGLFLVEAELSAIQGEFQRNDGWVIGPDALS